MKYFKDDKNTPHVIDDGFEYLLPIGLSEIDSVEYNELVVPKPLTILERKSIKKSEIDALEAKAYMRRGQRETWLKRAEIEFTAAGYMHAQVYAENPEYKRVYDENVLATALRAELKAIV